MGVWRALMYTPAIVAIGYDRPEALKRLLTSIESADYPEGASPVLVISIDNSGKGDVVDVANGFEYSHGRKVVIARQERMGLREHVLACGDLTDEYGSIIVLEDDIFVSPNYYGYACAALDRSDSDDRIGSISLYDHRFNVHVRESFTAIDDGYDNYYLQIASSWGQAYTKKQWDAFRSWYDVNKDRDLKGPLVPENISGWSDRSWLKYYIVYLIEKGKYCIYPRVSLTTNFGDVGTHAKSADADLQVPIAGRGKKNTYSFSTIDESRSVYDPFFESVRISIPEAGSEDVLVDLYGIKPVGELIRKNGYRYVLSSSAYPYKVIRGYGRQMRPVDANIVYGISGNDMWLYDTTEPGQRPAGAPKAHRLLYEYRGISAARMIEMIKYRIAEKFGRK